MGFGRLHVSPVMSAYLRRYPEVGADLRLSDSLINLVEEGVDLAVRIGHLPDSTLVARHVGEMRRIVVASKDYLAARGEPRTPAEISSHETIHFGAMSAAPDWRFVEDGREIRVASIPRFTTNSADAAIQRPEQGGGLTWVLAYQAAASLESRTAPNRARRVPAAGAADPNRLSDIAAAVGQGANFHRSGDRDRRLAFRLAHRLRFGTTRNVAFARATTTPSALIRLCTKQIVLPVLTTSLSTVSHCPTSAAADEIDRKRDRHQRRHAAHDIAAGMAHGVVSERCNQPAVNGGRVPLVCGFASRSPG